MRGKTPGPLLAPARFFQHILDRIRIGSGERTSANIPSEIDGSVLE
jgi:hypothetical protein